jgi:chromosome partitioning protein
VSHFNQLQNKIEMRIVFGNQKGGVGKSTLCVMLANYLTLIKKKDVLIMDMDFQKSIDERRQDDKKVTNGAMPYEVLSIETTDYALYAEQLKAVDDIIMIDLPGKIDDESLVPILKDADYIICPFDYEKSVFTSTLTFAKLLKYFDKDKQIFFVPNRVKQSINYEIKNSVDLQFSKFGTVTKPITDRVTLKRINTFEINEEQKKVVEEVFDFIYTKIG